MASCHGGEPRGPAPRPPGRRIVLVGNPNTGKSVLFGALSGRYVEVSNYPGTTVAIASARMGDDLLLDSPGVYGLEALSEEERITAKLVGEADLIVDVVDATTLTRDLYLTVQLAELHQPMIVVLTMWDEVRKLKLPIDRRTLSEEFGGVPVFPVCGPTEEGVPAVRETFRRPPPPAPQDAARDAHPAAGHDTAIARRARANAIADRVGAGAFVQRPLGRTRWLAHPIVGGLIAFGILAGMFAIIGTVVAQGLVGLTEGQFFNGIWEPAIRGAVSGYLPSWADTLLVGEFGVLTMTVTYTFGLLLPLVLAFYLFLALLEDSGYLPYLATLVDRGLRGVGLNGRAIIPLILGFGCVTMATLTTRILGTARERFIATALLGIAIPCSAQLGVVLGLLAGLGLVYWLGYGVVIFLVFAAAGTVLHRALPGQSSDLLLELPPLRVPRTRNVLVKTGVRAWAFTKEVLPLIFVGALVLSLLILTGALGILEDFFAPLTEAVLTLPKAATAAFILGFIRRDFGAAGLYDLSLSPAETLIALVVITLFVPCIASVLMISREQGMRRLALIWGGSLLLALVVGGAVAQVVGVLA